ncbi:hypothetical protein [Neotabrizicola sp. sgz301269]|uniref:hypothetical protein n=1 Tax=Neotabrizicola sp. sgz301269 TaxID=3276282 RepID=UPI00376F5D00
MKDPRLARLAQMAQMVEEAGTANLRRAVAAREAVRAQIEALDASRARAAPRNAAEARIAYAYEAWASRRRAALNLDLAKHEALCLSLLEEARVAFGRARVIDRLIARQETR